MKRKQAKPTSLYRMYSPQGDLLYVGISIRLPSRVARHREDKDWWFSIGRIDVEHFDTRGDAEAAERSAIKSENPQWNVRHRRRESSNGGVRELWGDDAAWIVGRGRYALAAYCRVLTVTLWERLEDAQTRRKLIDSTGCGGFCCRDHEIVDFCSPEGREIVSPSPLRSPELFDWVRCLGCGALHISRGGFAAGLSPGDQCREYNMPPRAICLSDMDLYRCPGIVWSVSRDEGVNAVREGWPKVA